MCDAHSTDLHEVHLLLYDANGYSLKESVIDRFGMARWEMWQKATCLYSAARFSFGALPPG